LAYGDKAKYVDVKSDNAKLQEMLKLSSGLRQVPIILESGKVTIGYGGT
jgi:glutaredoxin